MPLPEHKCDSCRFVERTLDGKIPVVNSMRPLYPNSKQMVPVKKLSYFCLKHYKQISTFCVYCKHYQTLPNYVFRDRENKKVMQTTIGGKNGR